MTNTSSTPDVSFMMKQGQIKAIKLVCGEEFCKQRVHGCQFHFKQQVQKKKNEVPEDMKEEFIDTCNQLCKVTSLNVQHT